MKVVAVIQARLGSTRLPGKVLADIVGFPMLWHVVKRVQMARSLHRCIVATSNQRADGAVVDFCVQNGIGCFCGSETDVLDRIYQAARGTGADAVVRITADCPLIDPEVIDRVVQKFLDLQPHVDYASNVFPQRTFPRGLDTEVMRFNVLERVWREDHNALWREHVTLYIHRNPTLFSIHGVTSEIDYSFMRWVVDTQEDLQFVRGVYQRLKSENDFNWREVVELLEREPELLEINRQVAQKVV